MNDIESSVDFNGISTVTWEAIFKAAACVLAESRTIGFEFRW